MSEQAEYLFLGGTNDGKRFYIPKSLNQVKLHKLFEPVKVGEYRPESFETECYRKERFRGCREIFEIFVSTDIDNDEVIRRLINCYNKIA